MRCIVIRGDAWLVLLSLFYMDKPAPVSWEALFHSPYPKRMHDL